MLEQEPMMAAHTDMAIMSFLMPGNGQKADIGLLKESVNELCRMTMQKTAGQNRPSGKGKYKEKDISWDNLERVKFQIICEAVLLVLSGKLDKLEDTPDDGIYETLHRREWER